MRTPNGEKIGWKAPGLDFVLGALIGAVLFFAVNTGTSLDVTNDSWILQGYLEQDIIQHYIGWQFYRESPLTFPLGVAANIGYPGGNAITFTDSIPLFAILFRLIEGILPQTFQYFGWFTLLCYMLQGGAAALLAGLFSRCPAVILGASVLFGLAPIFVERTFRHTALGAQFLIVFSLYLYFKNCKQGFRFRAGYYLLLAAATAIHPYFLPMVFAVLFADLVQQAFASKRFVSCAVFLGGGFAVVLAVAWVIGVFHVNASGGSDGYGYFSMNLNALFNPTSRGGLVWSQLVPVLPQTRGNYDGFNYLGLGVLLAAPVLGVWNLCRLGARGVAALVRRHWCLFGVCACLTVFAISHVVTLNGSTLFSIDIPATLVLFGNVFRSSGRMFYPIYYLILLFVLVQLGHVTKAGLRAALCALLLCVQLWDLSPVLGQKRAAFAADAFALKNPMQSSVWQTLDGQFDHLLELNRLLVEGLYPAQFAARNGMTNNSGWLARVDYVLFDTTVREALQQLRAGQVDPDTLYITSERDLFYELAETLGDKVYAARVDTLWYLLIPKNENLVLPQPDENFWIYPDFPLMLSDFTGGDWVNGVMSTQPNLCLFVDNQSTKPYLQNAEYILCDGMAYAILNKDYTDSGWVMITLDIADASVLCGRTLTVQ